MELMFGVGRQTLYDCGDEGWGKKTKGKRVAEDDRGGRNAI